jgi:DNA-binding transcriptional ArsR family regulator
MFMILRSLPELEAIQLADLFATLSDASRVRIISALLEEELSVGVLAENLGMSESAVSHQLRGLRQMHLVRARRQGRRMFYRLDDDHVRQLFLMGVDHVEHG